MSSRAHMLPSLGEILAVLGYDLEDDAWASDGRRTYTHEENAGRTFLRILGGAIAQRGFYKDGSALRTFRRHGTEELIEIEPGGSGVTGHLLHHMRGGTR